MAPVVVPVGVLLINQITVQDTCDFSQGHCFGNDGGTGVPPGSRVATGRGGNQEVWTLNAQGTQVTSDDTYTRCQYCQKYVYAGKWGQSAQ